VSFFQIVTVAVFGLIAGSFLNVVIYRLPKGMSLVHPPSHCPLCKRKILWYDNIPILSFILLKGKCRYCKNEISPCYPLVEGLTCFFFVLSFLQNPPFKQGIFSFLQFLKSLTFVMIIIPCFFIDLEHGIIPDSLSYTLFLSGIVFGLFQGNIKNSLVGAGAGAGIFLAILYLSLFLLHQPGMGGGDVKLAAGIGAHLGLWVSLLSFFLSFLSGAIFAAVFLLLRKKSMKDKIPFGPFLSAGALAGFFFGGKIIKIYINFLW